MFSLAVLILSFDVQTFPLVIWETSQFPDIYSTVWTANFNVLTSGVKQ